GLQSTGLSVAAGYHVQGYSVQGVVICLISEIVLLLGVHYSLAKFIDDNQFF
ncbi:hypothetical protein U1Q18_037965, partial [Sarracenia purpurea var. burkii]